MFQKLYVFKKNSKHSSKVFNCEKIEFIKMWDILHCFWLFLPLLWSKSCRKLQQKAEGKKQRKKREREKEMTSISHLNFMENGMHLYRSFGNLICIYVAHKAMSECRNCRHANCRKINDLIWRKLMVLIAKSRNVVMRGNAAYQERSSVAASGEQSELWEAKGR